MSKDPTPRADALRAQREARYGHLQATAAPPKLVPYAGKGTTTHESSCGAKRAAGPRKPPRKSGTAKRKTL